MMNTIKTKVNDDSVLVFLESLEHPVRKLDAFALLDVYQKVTGLSPKMWGNSIIGFGEYTYKNSKGKENTWMRSAFSPRKQYISLYLMRGVENNPGLLAKLGKHKHGKSCLNINKLEDVDMVIVEKLIEADMLAMNASYPPL
jgi:hypothetical protein